VVSLHRGSSIYICIYVIFITVFKIKHKLHIASGSRHYGQKLWVYACKYVVQLPSDII